MKIRNPIREGTIVEHFPGDGYYMISQVEAGLYLLISQGGNRWQDKKVSLKELPAYLKKHGFKVKRHGGF